MKLTIVHFGGTEKQVELEDIIANGWVQVRYPNGAGCYRFSLAHGSIEAARGTQPEWHLKDADLQAMRELAKERKIKWRAPCTWSTARSPQTRPDEAGGAVRMNAPIKPALPLLTTSEARAHLAIVTVLEDVYFCRIDDGVALRRLWKPLEAFSPRCNCRRKLMFGPWRAGSRIVACACGVSYFEADITHGCL